MFKTYAVLGRECGKSHVKHLLRKYRYPAENQEKAMYCNRRVIRKFQNLPKWQPDSN